MSTTHDSPQKEQAAAQFQSPETSGPEGPSQSPPAFQLMASNDQSAAPIQRQEFDTERNRKQAGNPINSAVSIVKGNYGGVGAGWLSTNHVAGIVYAESMLNTDIFDSIGDALGQSSSVGPGQLTEAAINQVDTSIGATARQQFEAQFGARPAGWREIALDPNWAYYYTAGYLAFCMTNAANTFQAVDGADSHIPLGMAMYQGAFVTMRDLRREIADEKGIARTDVTWKMIELKAMQRRNGMSVGEKQSFNYAQMATGGFDFDFNIESDVDGRYFYATEDKVKASCLANFASGGGSGKYQVQLIEHYILLDTVRTRRHSKVNFDLGSRQSYEWSDLKSGKGSQYQLRITNENGQPIQGSGTVSTTY